MNPALWIAIIAASQSTYSASEPSDRRYYAHHEREKPLPLWPRFLLWLIRRRTQKRLANKTWVRLDDWLWGHYFKAIEKETA